MRPPTQMHPPTIVGPSSCHLLPWTSLLPRTFLHSFSHAAPSHYARPAPLQYGCEGSMLLLQDVHSAPAGSFPELEALCAAQGAASALLAPMASRHGLTGGLVVLSAVPESFDYHLCRTVLDLASQLGNLLHMQHALTEARAGDMLLQVRPCLAGRRQRGTCGASAAGTEPG